jgi:hypothetical protein
MTAPLAGVLPFLNTPDSRSSASLRCMTLADHLRPLFARFRAGERFFAVRFARLAAILSS